MTYSNPPGYDLFQKLKEPLRGVCFSDFTTLYNTVSQCIRELNFGKLLNVSSSFLNAGAMLLKARNTI